jgi:tRNA(Ile2) C34 agmatinyltransferase TiaS
MIAIQRAVRIGAAAIFLAGASACANSLGNVLGGVLGGGSQEVSGTVQGVDTRSQQVFIQQSNGQTVGVGYDSRTQVVYQNQNYSVTSLERGDQVTVRIASSDGNGPYTDYIRVDQSVSPVGGTSGNVITVQGNVRQIDYNQGWFTLNSNNGVITVTLPYNPSRTDLSKFQNLRVGDYVRLYGTYVNQSRVELRNFY